MARSETTGRYIRPRRRLVGQGRRLRIVGPFEGKEVSGVVTGQPLVLGGGVEVETSPKPEQTAKRT